MTYTPIHLKYRPQTLSEVIGQETTTITLQNAVNNGHIAPVYLFIGSRGTGKTSTARILAKMINCQAEKVACNQCDSCISINNNSYLDVIEIDAASNSGVEQTREVIERAHFAPIAGRWKVIIIDECHSLSQQAWQTLLKTTEHPPKNVTFIFCTTEVQKVPETIKSRSQCFEFKLVSEAEIAVSLIKIANNESIGLDYYGALAIAKAKNGHMRDSQTLLDQLRNIGQTITSKIVNEVCGVVDEKTAYQLLVHLATANIETALYEIEVLMGRGRNAHTIITAIVDAIIKFIAYPNHPIKQVFNNQELQSIIKILTEKQHLTKNEFSVVWLQAILIEIARTELHSRFFDICKDWKTPNEAISWGKRELPNNNIDTAWENLEPLNGKKAPAWIYYIIREKLMNMT